MNTPLRLARLAGFLLLTSAVLLPTSVGAQVLSVSPTSVSVQAAAGTDAPSQTVQIRNSANGALKWTVRGSSSWVSVSPTSGVNSGNLTLTFRTSSLAAGQYQTSFSVESNGGSQTITVQATIGSGSGGSGGGETGGGGTGTATISVSSPTVAPGSSVTVSFSIPNPTSTDWISLSPAGSSVHEYLDWKYAGSCTRTPGTAKASGSCSFTAPTTAGTYEFRLFANNVFTLLASVTVTVSSSSSSPSPSPSPAPPSSERGPQSTITCPAGAVDIWPGWNIQSMVNNDAGNTTFCIRAGVHYLNNSITPKTGNTFIGEFGAVLDGSGWSTSDDTAAAFRAHNEDIDYVTIRNLVIRRMPQRGIHAFYWMSNNWTIEYNEIAQTKWGLVFANNFIVKNNKIHNNSAGGYLGTYAHNTLVEGNEIAYNGWEQKVGESANVTFRNNFVHHNFGDGIWYDSNNTGAIIEGNLVEDNGYSGIFYEISSGAVIRNNTIRRNKQMGVFISTSKNTQVHNNTIEDNFRGILYFVNCASVGGGTIGFDLANNSSYDNIFRVGTQTDVFATGFSWTGCTSTQASAYLNGSKNLTFSRNTYHVPALSGRYWLWNGLKQWHEWQALGQDTNGSLVQR